MANQKYTLKHKSSMMCVTTSFSVNIQYQQCSMHRQTSRDAGVCATTDWTEKDKLLYR
jgi:hypothetical protein